MRDLNVRRFVALLAVVLVICAVGASAASAAWCRGGVSVASARAKIGNLVKVKGRVASSHFARSTSGSPTFIDLGYAYPDARRLTLLIWQEDRGNFPRAPERMFQRGALVCAQGYVARYGGAAQIEVSLWDASSRLISF